MKVPGRMLASALLAGIVTAALVFPDTSFSAALTAGAMKLQAAGLSADAIQAVAIHLTGSQSPASRPKLDANLCEGRANPMRVSGPQWNGWGFDLENTRHQPAPQLKAEDVPRLKVKWAFAYAGGRVNSQPTVVGDRLFVASS